MRKLQQEKQEVRRKLQQFQEDFLVKYQRKIRFHKDILPIEREYRSYKQIKEELARLDDAMAAKMQAR